MPETKIEVDTQDGAKEGEIVPGSPGRSINSEDHLQEKAPLEGSDSSDGSRLLYGIDDVPPWYMCIFLGFQVCIIKAKIQLIHLAL